MDATGEMLWKTMRSLVEGVMRLTHMGNRIKATGARARAEAYVAPVASDSFSAHWYVCR
jgi:hypothetical protein